MRCLEVKQAIYTYLDGQLSSQVERAFFAHLSNCPACQQELNMARQTNHLLENFCTSVEPPPDFVNQVMSKIAAFESGKVDQPKPFNVVALPQKKETKENWFNKMRNSGTKLARVASFVILVAATGAFLVYNSIPTLPKIASNGGDGTGIKKWTIVDKGDVQHKNPVVPNNPDDNSVKPEMSGQDNPGAVVDDPGKNQPEPEPVPDNTPKPGLKDGDSNSIKTSDGKKETDTSTKNTAGGQDAAPLEEVAPPLPSFKGPFEAATVSANIPKEINPVAVAVENGYSNVKPDWNSGGKEVIYLSTKEADEGNYSIWSKDLNDGTVKIIAQNAAESAKPSRSQAKSPDGKRSIEYIDDQLFVTNLETNQVVAVTPKLAAQRVTFAWAADGKTIALSIKSKERQEHGLWLVQADGTDSQRVSEKGGGDALKWSPDGKKLAFTDAQNTIFVLLVSKGQSKAALLQVVPKGDSLGAMTLSWSGDSMQLLFDWAKPETNQRGIYLAAIPE